MTRRFTPVSFPQSVKAKPNIFFVYAKATIVFALINIWKITKFVFGATFLYSIPFAGVVLSYILYTSPDNVPWHGPNGLWGLPLLVSAISGIIIWVNCEVSGPEEWIERNIIKEIKNIAKGYED